MLHVPVHMCVHAWPPCLPCTCARAWQDLFLFGTNPHAVPLGNRGMQQRLPKLMALAFILWCLAAGPQDVGNALECIAEVLGFVISLIASQAGGVHDDLDVFGLELMTAALSAAKSGRCSAPCSCSAQYSCSPCSQACRCSPCTMHQPAVQQQQPPAEAADNHKHAGSGWHISAGPFQQSSLQQSCLMCLPRHTGHLPSLPLQPLSGTTC